MSTPNKPFSKPTALSLDSAITELNIALNNKRTSILDEYKVADMDVNIVRHINENEMQKMKEIGNHFKIKLSTLTSTVDKLEKQKLVKRKNSKQDRRVIYIHLTAKGQGMLKELESYTQKASEKVFKSQSAKEFTSMLEGIAVVLKMVKK